MWRIETAEVLWLYREYRAPYRFLMKQISQYSSCRIFVHNFSFSVYEYGIYRLTFSEFKNLQHLLVFFST